MTLILDPDFVTLIFFVVMKTKFKLIFEGDEPDINIPQFKKSLPWNFEFTKEKDGLHISLNSVTPEDDKCQFLIDRELDRHFFLTSVKIKASMIRTRVSASITTRFNIHGALGEDVKPQQWNYELPIQLKLWSIAIDSNEILLQIILFYQIIELTYTDDQCFPIYIDSTVAPAPLTECKFLRNMAAHSGDVGSPQLKRYCEYLSIPEVMHDPTDLQYIGIFKSKLYLLKSEAQNAIQKSL